MLPPSDSTSPPPADPAVDQLARLPTELLDKLLSGLPTREVVRTSVLSPPYRRSWETVPGLDVELHGVRDDAATWASAERFMERCAAPVGRVSIRDVPVSVYQRADHWVRAVAGKSPRSLSVALPLATPLPSVFRCDPDALTELALSSCTIPAPPKGFEGFPRLTRLDLDGVVFTTAGSARKQLAAMVAAAAPTLVELRLQDIAFFPIADELSVPDPEEDPWRWVIRAPNLRRLVLCLRIDGDGLEFGPLPNLELARIFLDDEAVELNYVKLFSAISNVRELHLGNFHTATEAGPINIFLNLLWKFQNLRILRIDGSFKECPTNHLFDLCPLLETLHIKRWY